MRGFEDLWGMLDQLGAIVDRLIGWLIVGAVIGGLVMLASIAAFHLR